MTAPPSPRLLSISVGRPRPVVWSGSEFNTAFLKQPVGEPVQVRSLGLDGDGQGSPDVHGGIWQAVYAYPVEHYAHWQRSLECADLGHGYFGENLTVAGLSEDSVRVGDTLTIGGVVLAVTHPRRPCAILEARVGRKGFAKEFQQSGRAGFYMRVLEEGLIDAGQAIVHQARTADALTITQLNELRQDASDDASRRALLRCAADDDALTPEWRSIFRDRLEKVD